MSKSSKWITGLVIGLFIGAAAGILLAPSKGDETREDLLKKIDLLKRKIAELIEKGGEYTTEKVDVLKSKISDLESEIVENDTVEENSVS